jgi:import inner membrane translocase subunit TIM22
VGGGCVAGGLLAARGGPSAMLIGCGGFALFSAAIETYMMS